jgi:hypothetical protein
MLKTGFFYGFLGGLDLFFALLDNDFNLNFKES